MRYDQFKLNEFDPERLLSVIPGTEMLHQLMGRGEATVDYQSCRVGSIEVYTAFNGSPIWANGLFPGNTYFFGLRGAYSGKLIVNEMVAPKTGLSIFPPGSEVRYMTTGAERWIIFRVPETLLRQTFRQLYCEDLHLPITRVRVLDLDADVHRLLTTEISEMVAYTASHCGRMVTREMESLLENTFVQTVAYAIGNGHALKRDAWLPPSERIALRELQAYTKNWVRLRREPLTMPSFPRKKMLTLERATRHAYGISPSRLLKLACLNAVYREFSHGRSRSVSQALRRWHIGKPGHFVSEYRKLFNESPRETVGRVARQL